MNLCTRALAILWKPPFKGELVGQMQVTETDVTKISYKSVRRNASWKWYGKFEIPQKLAFPSTHFQSSGHRDGPG